MASSPVQNSANLVPGVVDFEQWVATDGVFLMVTGFVPLQPTLFPVPGVVDLNK